MVFFCATQISIQSYAHDWINAQDNPSDGFGHLRWWNRMLGESCQLASIAAGPICLAGEIIREIQYSSTSSHLLE